MTRLKAKSFQTRTEFFDAVDAIATHETELRALAAKRDAAIQTVQAEYAPYIDAHETSIKGLIALAEKYAEEHRDELLTKTKSSGTQLATYGFRTNPPTLKTLSKKWTWEKVLAAIKEQELSDYLRTTEEVDKDAIKAAKLDAADLAEIGLKIVQPEDFFVEPKVDGSKTIKQEVA